MWKTLLLSLAIVAISVMPVNAAITIAQLSGQQVVNGVRSFGPTRVISASEENLGTPNTAVQVNTRGIRTLSMLLIFANYTSVSVKFQQSFDDGTTWHDLGAALTATGTKVAVTPDSPLVRVSAAGTLSASADTMQVWLYGEGHPVAVW